MGGCVCSNNCKGYFKGSECVLNSESNKNDKSHKIPEQNIKIIPREVFDKMENNNEDSKQNEKNEKIINKITKNNNSNTHDENHISMDNNSNNNLYLQNTKHKEIENNKDSNNNNSISINKQLKDNKNDNNNNNNNNNDNDNNNSNNNNNNNNNNSNNNNNIKMDNILPQNLQEKAAVKKAETNYNYNLGDHNFIFINISRDSSIVKNGSEKVESTTPKMAVEKENIEEMVKGSKRIFSHFCKNKIPEKSPKNQTTTNNHLKRKITINDYMNHYSDEMLNTLNTLRKNPESFITFIDDLMKNSKKTNEGVFITSHNVDDKYMLMEDYFLVFEQIKRSLKDIIKSNLPSIMEDFKYNDDLEIMLDDTKDYTMNQSHIEKSSSISNNNDKYNSSNNNLNNLIIKRSKKNQKILDLSDDKIANLILEKRKEIKDKYPDNIFKMNIIKDIKINILMQISMEEYYNQYDGKRMLKDIIFNPQYKNFAVSWANELNRKFISISCFA